MDLGIDWLKGGADLPGEAERLVHDGTNLLEHRRIRVGLKVLAVAAMLGYDQAAAFETQRLEFRTEGARR